MQLDIANIRTDGGTQPRTQLDAVTIADYAEAMGEGAAFPPVVVFFDGTYYWLADGFHRVQAAQRLGLAGISADVRQGTLQDAQWHSYSVNQTHGLRRTNDDKRRAVEAALQHPYAAYKSEREIARHCGVSPATVYNYKRASDQFDQIDTRIVTRNGQTYEMNTANIGRGGKNDNEGDWWDDDQEPLTPYEQTIANQYEARQQAAKSSRNVSVVHETAASVEWYTPQRYIDAAHAVMGGIDTDPASNNEAQRRIGAATYYTIDDDGFDKPWRGRVWLNPPYGVENGRAVAGKWAERLIEQFDMGITTEAILLVNAVIDSKWFNILWRFPICFTDHRIRFDLPEGTPKEANTSPVIGSAIVYLGSNIGGFVREFSQFGAVVGRMSVYDGHVYVEALEENVTR